ncbi:MAG: thioredoxin family protein [Planctomycetota bacterium]
MPRLILSIAMLVAVGSPAGAAERFIITERETSSFVVAQYVPPVEFVVTDRLVSAAVKPGEIETAATRRPVVILYTATWCAPCRAARQALQQSRLPFDLQFIDITHGGQPAYVDSIPYFEWDAPGGRRFAKWTNVAELVRRWQLTQ